MKTLLTKVSPVVFSIVAIAATSTPGLAFNGFEWRHPRRAEVLHRDNVLNREINNNAGYLHGNFGRLKQEDASIHRQEQFDARMNGGFITRGEQHRLNREENSLQRQINFDRRF